MYVTPNGMIFESYGAAMDYNRKEIEKEFDTLFWKNETVCPACKNVCIKSEVRDIYICGHCNRAFSLEVVKDESKD